MPIKIISIVFIIIFLAIFAEWFEKKEQLTPNPNFNSNSNPNFNSNSNSNSNLSISLPSYLPNKITCILKTQTGMNLVYINNNFYLIKNTPYIFSGTLDTNGLYVLESGIENRNLILNYNVSNTSKSNIILKPFQNNPNLTFNPYAYANTNTNTNTPEKNGTHEGTQDTSQWDPEFTPNTNPFNQPNKNIYLDPVNKVILSNDNTGNTVYLTNSIYESPVDWDYNMNNATLFDINYI